MEYMAEALPSTEQHSVDIQRQPAYYLGPGGRQFESARPDQIQLSYGLSLAVFLKILRPEATLTTTPCMFRHLNHR